MKAAQAIQPGAKAPLNRSVLSISKRDWLADLSCAALLLFAFFPMFVVFLGRWINYIRYIFVLGFLLSVAKRDWKLFFRLAIVLTFGFLFSCYFYYQVWHLYCTFPAFMAKSMLGWIYSCFALYYGKYGNQQGKKRIRTLWMIILVVTSITTIISVGDNPIAARALANADIFDTAETRALYLRNTASWGIMYGMVFTLPMWIAQFKRTKNPWYMVVIVSVTVCAIVAQITFAVIFAVVFLLCFFLRSLDTKKVFIFVAAVFVFMMLFQDVISWLLHTLYENMSGSSVDIIRQRIYEMYLIFGSGQVTGDANTRITLYTSSLTTFLRNPILGRYMSSSDYNIIGMHSQLLDTMAGTGILGMLSYSGTYIYIARKSLVHLRNARIKMYFTIAIIVLALFMLANPVWYAPESFMSVFLLPCLLDERKGDNSLC